MLLMLYNLHNTLFRSYMIITIQAHTILTLSHYDARVISDYI